MPRLLIDACEIADEIDCDERAGPAADRDFVKGDRWPDEVVPATHVLDLSERQVRQLLERIRTGNAVSTRHVARL